MDPAALTGPRGGPAACLLGPGRRACLSYLIARRRPGRALGREGLHSSSRALFFPRGLPAAGPAGSAPPAPGAMSHPLAPAGFRSFGAPPRGGLAAAPGRPACTFRRRRRLALPNHDASPALKAPGARGQAACPPHVPGRIQRLSACPPLPSPSVAPLDRLHAWPDDWPAGDD